MTVARAAGFGALLLVVVLAAYLLVFRGSGGHEYTLMFQNAGQLVKDDDVQIGGRRIGSIKDIKLKVQASMQDAQVRVVGKNRDDLQKVIALVRGIDLPIEVSMINFRD